NLAPLHGRFFVEEGQLFVEDLSEGKGVFVRLIATYTLQDGDGVLMGKQLMQFREKVEAVAAAAATGTTVMNMSEMIKEPVAEFVRLTAEGVDNSIRFPGGRRDHLGPHQGHLHVPRRWLHVARPRQ